MYEKSPILGLKLSAKYGFSPIHLPRSEYTLMALIGRLSFLVFDGPFEFG